MEKKRKVLIIGFIIFLILMGICDLISKGIYKAKLPRVTITSVREMPLYHSMSASGVVAAGQEYGIYVPEGLRVATIIVQKGDSFEAGDPILQLDTEDLENILTAKELEHQQLIYQQREANSQKINTNQNNTNTLTRAQEDYDTVKRDCELQVSRARESLVNTQNMLEQSKKELERISQQKEQNDSMRQTSEPLESVSNGDNTNINGDDNGNQNTNLTSEIQQLEYQISQLEQEVRTAEQAVEDALLAQEDRLKEAQRNVDDARTTTSGSYDSTEDILRLKQVYMEREISELQDLMDADGWIYARESGRITMLYISTGQRTSDTAQLLYTPDNCQRLLQAQLSEEQTKYVSVGTRMQLSYETVSGGRQSCEGIVSYMETLENGNTMVQLDVTEQGLELGQQVTLKSNWQSENYELVVPVSVLQKDSNNNYFLYIIQQQNGILGMELHASRLYVNVLDQNSSYAAIESAALSADTDIILTTSSDIKDNAVVRVIE